MVKITSGTHVVSLTIGSRTAWVRGHKVTLPAPPEMSAGILMVPLRQVAEGLGGKLEKKGAGIIIRMEAQEEAGTVAEETPNIDNDEGKTQIGNSYYDWSMNYQQGSSSVREVEMRVSPLLWMRTVPTIWRCTQRHSRFH